jgi:crossover junction endodeoxyribonuclease RuvC
MPPSCLKVYATGNGRASKDGVRAAIAARYGHVTDGPAKDDEADAYTAMAAGHDWLGHPLKSVPTSHRRGLEGCKWPEFLSGGALR